MLDKSNMKNFLTGHENGSHPTELAADVIMMMMMEGLLNSESQTEFMHQQDTDKSHPPRGDGGAENLCKEGVAYFYVQYLCMKLSSLQVQYTVCHVASSD